MSQSSPEGIILSKGSTLVSAELSIEEKLEKIVSKEPGKFWKESDERFVLRHWRGNGQIIPDRRREFYHDYPKHRGIRPYQLSECFYKEITLEEYLECVLQRYGQKEYDKEVLKYKK